MEAYWEQKYSNLNCSNNYYGIFSTMYREIPVRAFVYASCSINEFDEKRVMFATLFFEASEDKITDSIFHAVSDDCIELVKQNIPDDNLFQTAFISYYSTDRLPDNIPFTYGDYTL